ncbi:TIGR04283 family arsenosugar biosynthesis glycosyltransferase [Psychroflexus sp. CAK57W]|uniref:TIGR04283 family arsenosugar biosynthesis glycosyltransferase n=1 Tax=Psychroflexus curvus TaxID=2873595 RepID=UPI001CCC8995|nr:TIGR04283 family arsenosugar biosynthesis glycosyltransferase [Psychroflexus curvus]MBZ9787097.1 TIGR04283 family arsenosugar biosynthesis glycosyltransferase [Psychroflexus curvus]
MISIIIPVYNEAEIIEANLQQIQKKISASSWVGEILVIDGGSDDHTIEKARAVRGIQVYVSPKGRPRQMNFGAKQATGEILYFLHIDSFPPQNFDEMIVNSIKNGHEAGCFQMKFRSNHLWLKFISWLTKFRARSCRGGDQSLFVTKSLFENIGGYDEDFLIYEDHEILKPIYEHTRFDVIPQWILTSARRFEEKGILKLQLLFWGIYFKKWLGASSEELYRFYEKHINNTPTNA